MHGETARFSHLFLRRLAWIRHEAIEIQSAGPRRSFVSLALIEVLSHASDFLFFYLSSPAFFSNWLSLDVTWFVSASVCRRFAPSIPSQIWSSCGTLTVRMGCFNEIDLYWFFCFPFSLLEWPISTPLWTGTDSLMSQWIENGQREFFLPFFCPVVFFCLEWDVFLPCHRKTWDLGREAYPSLMPAV